MVYSVAWVVQGFVSCLDGSGCVAGVIGLVVPQHIQAVWSIQLLGWFRLFGWGLSQLLGWLGLCGWGLVSCLDGSGCVARV